MVSSPLQQLHAGLSPRRSTFKTIPSAPRTFSDILSWPEFVSEACQLEDSLDDAIHQYALPTVTMQAATGISSAADESEVRGAIMLFLYSTNEAAKLLGIGVECVGGGSGRSSSFTDLVVRRTGQPTSPSQLSLLILGPGEVKGIWQLSLQQERRWKLCCVTPHELMPSCWRCNRQQPVTLVFLWKVKFHLTC